MSRSFAHRRLAAPGTVIVAAILTAALLPASAEASRSVSETYVVPAGGTLRVTGHGFGHGHGMSQYGAQGAAGRGLSHQQILSYYYPGTAMATTSGNIRVLITADTDHDVRVLPASGLRVRDLGSRSSYTLPVRSTISSWRLRTVGGRTALEFDNGSWHAYRPGGRTLSGDAEFYRAGSVQLRLPGHTRAYRGALRLSGSETVNVLGMDDYLKGVVPSEMPASWQPAALRSQAVAARTYAAYDRAAHPSRSWQTCDSTSCQVYGGVAAEDARTSAAVAATSNQVLTYRGQPAFTQFGSSSGGWLSAGGVPYLVAKADRYDGLSGNPVHTWSTTITRTAIQKAWPSLGTLRRVLVTQRDGHGEWYGRVEQMTLDGSKANVTLTGTAFRSRFGLRSQWFHFGT